MNPVQTPLKRIETTHPDNAASDDYGLAGVKPNPRGLRGIFNSVREAGERVTGGGVRALGKRLFLQSVRRFMAMIMRRLPDDQLHSRTKFNFGQMIATFFGHARSQPSSIESSRRFPPPWICCSMRAVAAISTKCS